MSNHNYSQYSTNKNNDTNDETITNYVNTSLDDAAPVPTINFVEETVETVTLPKTVTGTVINCAKLNVRTDPSITSESICVLDVNSELEIDVTKSTDEWFSICTATGIEGYCMRKYVEASL